MDVRLLSNMELESILTQNLRQKPEDLLVCRVCLETNTKLFNLLQLSLKDNFVKFTETPVSATDGIPQYICHYCFALLCKALCFQTRCQHTYKVLQEICANGMVTTDIIRNEVKPKLTVHLAVTPTENIDLPAHNQRLDISPDPCDVKYEMIDDANMDEQCNFDETHFEDIHEILPMVFESASSQPDIKNEDCKAINDDSKAPDDIKAVADDCRVTAEELSIVKPKETLKRSPRKKVRKVTEKAPKKRKRRYNQKFEEDFVAFAKMYNVEVIFLTKEQQIEKAAKEKQSIESQNYPFTCDQCYKGFKSPNAFKKHSVLHDPNRGDYVCDVCNIRFSTKKQMQVHVRIHKIEFVCNICQQVNKNSFNARVHYIFHEGQKFECKYCNKKFNAQSTKLNHVREIHKPLTCDICQKKLTGTIALNTHKKTVHLDHAVNLQQCSECGVEFQNAAALKRHRCDPRAALCPACGAAFPSRDQLALHTLDKHKDTANNCPVCPATFTTERGLQIHWNRGHLQLMSERKRDKTNATEPHTEASASSYMCEICAKNYTTAVGLRDHQRIHTGEKPFQCHVCQRNFRLKIQLKIHMNIHTGERPYKCKFCPETYKSYAQLHKHKLMVHLKQRPYKCHLCEKTYVVSYDLKTHIKHSHMHVPRPPRRNRNRHPVNKV